MYQTYASAIRVAGLLGVLILSGSTIFGQTLTVTASGTYTSGSATNTFTAPNSAWTLSFQVSQVPVVTLSDSTQFRTNYTNAVFTLHGVSVPVTGNTVVFEPSEINIFLDSPVNTQLILTVPQTFTGATTSPTIQPGSYPVSNVTSYFNNPAGGFFDGFSNSNSNLVISATAPGTVASVLPHVADGNGFDTLALLINTGASDANYSLQFFDQTGNAVGYPLDTTQSGMTGVIHAGSQVIVRTAGSGSVTRAGWGQLTAPPSVKGMLIYQQQASPTSLQEGSAPIGVTSGHFFIPFDNVGAVTSIGFVNPSTSQNAAITMVVRYAGGGTDTVPQFTMNPGQQMALPVSSLWSGTAGQRGMIEVISSVAIGLVAFRFEGSAFTLVDTIAPTAGSSTPITSTIAHTADGNNFRSTFLLTNSGTFSAPYTLSILGPTGQPETFGFDVASPLSGLVPAGSTLTIDTTGLDSVTNLGWAQLSAPPAISGIEIFRQTNPGSQEQQATVPISQTVLSHFFAPFDNAANTTSIALANPDPVNTALISVTFRYVDGTTSTSQIALGPLNYRAGLIANIFTLAAGEYTGVAEFSANVPVAMVEVRFNPTQAFTSLRAVGP